jgi:SAM-dependent methyltransferase
VTLVFAAREAHPVVDLMLRDSDRVGAPVDRSIDAEDEMLHFARLLHDGDEDAALPAYFRDGLSVATVIRQLAASRAGGLGGLDAMLDFASGYGRVTRFLVREIPPQRLWVSDIYRGAVEFQTSTFGVQGLISVADPEAFDCRQRFDLIFVTSLFTHLPERTFRGWLRRLLALLTPGGRLAFSVHDESLLQPGQDMPAGGLRFEASSESRSLDPQAYGSTWVSEAFVRAVVGELAPGAPCVRLPRALGRFQDLYVLDLDRPGASAKDLDLGPFGFLDRCALRALPGGGRELQLRGWAAQASEAGEVAAVRIRVGGATAVDVVSFDARPDVQAAFPEAGARTGFELAVALPERCRHGVMPLVVEAETSGGVGGVLYAGTVAQALLGSTRAELASCENLRRHEAEVAALRNRQLELDAEALRARIAAMEASRFWKLRNAWFRAKRAAGLTQEP